MNCIVAVRSGCMCAWAELRGSLLLGLLCLPAFTQEGAGPAAVEASLAQVDADLLWYDSSLLSLEGRGWSDPAAPHDRLPARAQGLVRDAVWGLSRHSAGLCYRFESDATQINARWTLTSAKLEMEHMPATGVSGLDLYVRVSGGPWRWLGVGRPRGLRNEARLAQGLPPGRREYLLYLPLYNGVGTLSLGLPADARVWPARQRPPALQRPIIFYGTSITQGACASRPGATHVARIGRSSGREVVNLGFSGNGRLEPELAGLLGELDAAAYVLDCLPNLTAPQVAERTAPFVRALRALRPSTPILLVEDRTYGDAHLVQSRADRNASSRAALREAFESLQAEGVAGIHYLPGAGLLSPEGDDTVDGSHPSDLGFARHAEVMGAALAPLLALPSGHGE